jgi:MFS family permease
VALIAMMMALNALAIDAMLPALPAIGDALGVASENSRQWVLTAYLLGFGVAQIIYGPLADRFGRKPILMIGLSLYVLFSVLAAFSPTFELLIAARIGTGIGAAAMRVLAVSIVRDTDGTMSLLDGDQPLSTQRGKPLTVQQLALAKPTVMIGDGSTDAAVRGVVTEFIAYTGVARRENVVAVADAEADSFAALYPLLFYAAPSR